MELTKLFIKYQYLISWFIISNFANVLFIYLYLNTYMLSYLYYKDKYFNLFYFKQIIPSNSLGYFLGAFFIFFFSNVFGYKKSIQISLFIVGLTIVLYSYSYSCLIYCFLSFINGIFYCICLIFVNNLLFSLYPKKVGLFGGLISGGWCLSYLPINYFGLWIVNNSNSTPKIKIYDSILIFKFEEIKNLPIFFFFYGLFLIFLSFILTFTLKNPEGIQSKFSNYVEHILFRSIHYSNKKSTNLELIKSKNYYLRNVSCNSINLFNSTSNLNSILLRENNEINNCDNDLEEEIQKQTFYNNLFSKRFIFLIILFTNFYVLYTFYSLNLKIIGFKYYVENVIINLSLIIFFINFLGRILSGYLIQKYKFKYLLYLFNIVFLFGIVIRLISSTPLFLFLISYIIIFFGISIAFTCFYLACVKIYGEGILSLSLNGIIESTFFIGTFLEYFLEMIQNKIGIFNSELILLIIIFINIFIV